MRGSSFESYPIMLRGLRVKHVVSCDAVLLGDAFVKRHTITVRENENCLSVLPKTVCRLSTVFLLRARAQNEAREERLSSTSNSQCVRWETLSVSVSQLVLGAPTRSTAVEIRTTTSSTVGAPTLVQ